MTNPDLAALSAAAPQGEWRIHGAMLGYKGDIFSPTAKQVQDCHHIARFYAPKPARQPLSDLEAIGASRIAIAQIEANAAFVVSLVNEYRAGRLVQIDEGTRERVAWRMWKAEADRAAPNVGRNRTLEAFQNDTRPDERKRWLGLADAAIAAMMGGAK